MIYKLDPATFAILDSFPSPGSFPNDLAWDGQFLWVLDNGTDLLYQYDVNGTTLIFSGGFESGDTTRWWDTVP